KLQWPPGPPMGAGEEYVTAGQLLDAFGEARHTPMMVLLSACQTASGDGGDGDRVNALPFAARLVCGAAACGGVPVVVAMAGDISDTASRVFTRALAAAIGTGATLGEAGGTRPRAAVYRGPPLHLA